jgi:hypothetical protein
MEIPSDVRLAWLRQLVREMQSILFHHRLSMAPAALRLEPLGRDWGRYEPQNRCIVLSLDLLQQYPWDVVLEVLKHEMAHQWLHEKLDGVGAAAPHGRLFAEACRRLAVADWAASASGDLPTELGRRADAADPQTRRLLDKVQKLLALAGSSNEHEAALAMQRVREISARHALVRADLAEAPPQTYQMLHRKRRRLDRLEGLVVGILSKYFGVQALYTSQYDAADLQVYKAVEISGTAEQVAFAEYVYKFLHQQVVELAEINRWKWTGSRRGKASYQQGILGGFADKLAQQQVQPPESMPAARAAQLMRLGEAQAAAYRNWRHPRVRSFGWGRQTLSAASYAAGEADGHDLVLHRPLEAAATSRGRLLTG